MSMSLVVLSLAVFSTSEVEPGAPGMVVAAWPSGLLGVRIALDSPAPEGWRRSIEGRSIELFRSGEEQPRAKVAVARATLEDGGRTLRLDTDPHPAAGTYRLELPAPWGVVSYGLGGVEASWWRGEADEDRPADLLGWLPSFDLRESLRRLETSAPHRALVGALREPGLLRLRSLVRLPEGDGVMVVRGPAGIAGEVDFEALDFVEGVAERAFESFGEPVELVLRLDAEHARGLPRIEVFARVGDGPPIALTAGSMLLPWAPVALGGAEEPTTIADSLRGGDVGRGEAIFFGEQAKCSTCHRVGDRGEAIGPDLSKIGAKYEAGVLFREVENPSAAIAPEYQPFTLAMVDGRVLAGLVRSEGEEGLRVIGADGKAQVVLRSELEEIRATATSIMPVGLVGVIGEAGMRDLLAYLESRR